jgi:hypothetical protein
LKFVGTGTTVADFFAQSPGVAALAYYKPISPQSPTGNLGLTIFFLPTSICTDSALWDSNCQISNQSLLFHEGLHEFYGLADKFIQPSLGVPVIDCTADITDYISFTIYVRAVNSCGS